jgi:hypothetical protein
MQPWRGLTGQVPPPASDCRASGAAAGGGGRAGGGLEAGRDALDAVGVGPLAQQFGQGRVAQAVQGAVQGGREEARVAAAERLAEPGDQVRSAPKIRYSA